MALHPAFSASPCDTLEPAHYWFPADEALRESTYEKLLPPLVAPNIIVLDRQRADFDGLRIFFNDPVLPDNGHAGRNWRDDFQLSLHLQDDVHVVREVGNLVLTNVHRVHLGDLREPALEDDDPRDHFLGPFGPKPAGKTADSRTDLGDIVREIDELAVFNDEAHHIHDRIRLRDVRPLRTQHRDYLTARKSLFNRIVGEPGAGGFVFVDQPGFERHAPKCLAELATMCREYQQMGAA